MKTLALALLSLLLVASSSLPSSALASGKKEEKSDKENLQYVAVSPVALPVLVRGVVVNYVFVTLRVELTNSASSTKVREKEPYFRDAIVRAAHRGPFNKPGDYTHVDEAKVIASLYRDALVIVGPGVIKSVSVVSQQPKSYQVSAPA